MKKVITIVITFVMLFSSVSFADSKTDFYCGTWFYARETKGPYYYAEWFHLYEDGSCFHSSVIIDGETVDDGSTDQLIKWETTDDGICIEFVTGFKQRYHLLDDGTLSDGESFAPSIFRKIYPEKGNVSYDMSPVGMWSFYWDARELNEILGSRRMSFDIQSYSLFLLDDGSAYVQKAAKKQSGSDFTPELISGIWIGDASDMTIKAGNNTYKAWIDGSGRLYFKMTDSMAFIFNRVPLYDYEEGFLDE